MENKISKHIRIARHIVDGSLTIDSVKEFQSILRIFPNDPALHRVYADLQVRKKSFMVATASYRRAATTLHPLTDGQKEAEKSTVYLMESDFFGDIYP